MLLPQAESTNNNKVSKETASTVEPSNISVNDPNITIPQTNMMKGIVNLLFHYLNFLATIILRFFSIKIFIVLYSESLNHEEEEVRKMLRECLDLREKYVFRENHNPWTQPNAGDSALSEFKNDPFRFIPVETTKVSWLFDHRSF